MKVSHIMYRVSDLKEAVEEYRQKGFAVEYGRAKNPINALIYFSEGPSNDIQIPFFMTYFNIDPKPKNFVHPNGIARIRHVTFSTRKELFPLIRELCDDEILELCEGDGREGFTFEYEEEQYEYRN